MSRLCVVSVPQVDGWTRYVALSAADARLVRDDMAMLDHVTARGVVDVRGAERVWYVYGAVDTLECHLCPERDDEQGWAEYLASQERGA